MRAPGTCLQWFLTAALVALISSALPPLASAGDETDFTHFGIRAAERDYREAFHLPAAHCISLGAIPEGGRLRVGLLAGEGAGTEAALLADGREIQRLVAAADSWSDHALDLSAHAGAVCQVCAPDEHGLLVSPVALSPGPVPPHGPNLLVLLIDTLRRDHLGAYGDPRGLTPHLDALAAEGVLVEGLSACSSWTRPAVATTFSGVYPNRHGAHGFFDELARDIPWLPEILRRAGYETAAIVGNPHVTPRWGFSRGYLRYDAGLAVDFGTLEAIDARLADRAVTFLESQPAGPWLLYLHFMGPHEPYEAPAPFGERFPAAPGADAIERLAAAYAGEIAHTDAQIGRVIEALRGAGQYENTLIAVLSDHGEELGEHGGVGHSRTLYEEVLQVPFVLRFPGGRHAGRTWEAAALSMTGVAPTLLHALGFPPAPGMAGASWIGPMTRGGHWSGAAYAALQTHMARLHSLRDARYKWITDDASGQARLFDLLLDPAELHALEHVPVEAARLRHALDTQVMTDAAGLHLQVDGTPAALASVQGAYAGPAVTALRVTGGTLTRSEGAAAFASGGHAPEAGLRLHVPAPPAAEARLTLVHEGGPIRLQDAQGGVIVLEDAPLDLAAITGDAASGVAAGGTLHVELWYVRAEEAGEPAELDADWLDALGALGYL